MVTLGNRCLTILLLISCLVHVSCSVKEDRDVCPCLLNLNFIQNGSVSNGIVEVSVFSQTDVIFDGSIELKDHSERVSVSVPRGLLHVGVWAGAGDSVSEQGITIPFGMDCPRVYMHDSDIIASGETYDEDVHMHKNHCVLTVHLAGDGAFDMPMTIIGNVAGYDRYGLPLAGEFSYSLNDSVSEDGYQVVIPRQIDSSLMLMVDDGGDGVKYFSLGQYLESSGYDWMAPDLEDVSVTLDYTLTEIALTIGGWDVEYRYEVEI